MSPTPLWLFAHRALSPQFHRDPYKLITRLASDHATRYLERLWTWSLDAVGADAPITPPVIYGIERLPEGGVHLRMRFAGVAWTGEPYLVSCVIKDREPSRMFLLEHSELASERAGRPLGIVCESQASGHRSSGALVDAHDDRRFEDEIVRILLRDVIPLAETG